MENESTKCPVCGADLGAEQDVCPECGAALAHRQHEVGQDAVTEMEPEDNAPAEEGGSAPEVQPPVKESRKERKQREKAEAKLNREAEKQAARDAKAAAKAARKAERKYRNIPTVITLVLIVIVLAAGLGFLGWEYIGARSGIDSLTAENLQLTAGSEDLTARLNERESRIDQLEKELEEKMGQISQGDAAAEESSKQLEEMEEQIRLIRENNEKILSLIAEKSPLGTAASGSFSADRAVILLEDGDSVPVNFTVSYGAKKTVLDYTFEKGTANIDTVSLSETGLSDGNSLISLRVRKKNAQEDALAVLRFTNDQSDDWFFMVIVVK